MKKEEKNRSTYGSYLAYTIGLTILCILMLILLSVGLIGDTRMGDGSVDLFSIALFLGLGVIARAMSLNAMGVQVSIDTVVFTAAAFHLNGALAGWVVFAATTGFDLCKIAAERELDPAAESHVPWWMPTIRTSFAGATSSMLVVFWSMLFGISNQESYDIGTLMWLVPLFTASFLISQYSIVGISFRLRDPSFRNMFREVAVPSFLTEFSLVPVTLLMVNLYDESAPGRFLILSAICLSFIFVLRRIAVTSSKLLARIRELEIVNTFGQMMSSTLDADFLADRIADGVLAVYRNARVVVIARPSEEGAHLECLVYDSKGSRVSDPDMSVAGPIAQWIVDTGNKVRGNVGSSAGPATGRGTGWVGNPIISMGEVVGALLCHTSERESESEDSFRLMELLSRQAAVALHNSSLYEQATVDGLTRLFVRRYFDQRLDEEFHRAKRYHSGFSVILIDVDDFKVVNDSYLHETGDKILQMVASVMRNCIRAMDVPCRLGGDEFAIILPEASEESATQVGERICEGVKKLSLTRKGKMVSVTVSIGVANFPSSGAETPSEVMQKGDIALYRAKAEEGKSRVYNYSQVQRDTGHPGPPRPREVEKIP